MQGWNLINQAKYIKDMLKKFGFEDVKEIGTPMSPITKHDKDEKRCEPKAL